MASPAPDRAEEPARIQPHGVLIGLTPEWRIARTSANFGDHLGHASAPPIGELLADVLGDEAVHTLRNRLSLLRDPLGIARVFALPASGFSRPIDVAMHLADDEIIIEALPDAGKDSGDPIGLVRALATRLDGHDQLGAMANEGARQLRALTGFDRVSLFRWTADGSAKLAAHCARGDLAAAPTPVTGDSRLIVDAAATAIAIDPEPGSALIDRCLLRAPGPADRDAMGSAASLARFPLVAGGDEWGAAVCLNDIPRHLGLERFAAAELFSDLLALRIALLEARA